MKPEDREGLHLFDNEDETFIARDTEDAWELFLAFTGNSRSTDDDEDGFWVQVPDDTRLTVIDNEKPGNPKVTKTAAEWARENGRGFLCSTEY